MVKWRILVVCTLLLLISVTAYPQGTNAVISGIVRDQTGAVLPGVSIQINNRDTGIVRTTTTDESGRYRVPALDAGTYTVQGSLSGFRTVVKEGVALTVGSQVVMDLTTEVGQLSENVAVTADVPLVQTESAELSGLVGDKEIRDLPLNGRSYDALAFLQPGVSNFTNASTGTTATVANGAGAKMSVAGTPTDFSSFLMDGTDIHDHAGFTPGSVAGNNLGVDAILEFRVLTQNYSAEYGRTAGGVISAITRAGTNAFHGSVFEFFRNNALDAREFFDQGGTKPFHRNQFGGALGGPIRHDKTFFFANYEGLRQNRTQTLSKTLVTDAARQGILPGGRTVTVSPLMKPYLALLPSPNGRDFGDGTAEFLWAAPTVVHEDFYSIRVDHQISGNHSLFGRLMTDTADSTQPNTFPGFNTGLTSLNLFSTVEHKFIISPRILNVARIAFNRTNPNLLDQVNISGDSALRFVPTRTWSLSSTVSSFSDIGHLNSAPQNFQQNIYQYTDDLDVNLGAHSMKMGFNFERIQNNNETQTSQSQYQFTDISSLLQARPTRFVGLTLDSGTTSQFRQSFVGYYFQDDWKVNKALTLNLGMRHEFVTIPFEKHGRQANILNVFADTGPTFGSVFTKNPSLHNFAPRFGFAWVPFGERRPVIRGGAGIYYNEIMGRLYYQYARSGFLKTAQINNPTFPNPGLQSVNAGNVSYSVWTPQPSTPTVYQYNLTVEQQLPWNTVITASYVGSQGRHWVRDRSPNTRVPLFASNKSPVYGTTGNRINPAFGNIRQIVTDSNASYNGLQLQVTRRQSTRLVWQTSYTYSSAMSAATAWGAALTSNTSDIAVNPLDSTNERSLSSFHIRHLFAFNTTYHLPGDNLRGIAGILGRGWETSTIISARSGLPFSTQLGFNRSNDQNTDTPERPSLKPGASNNPIIGSVNKWYDPAAFILPAAGTYGNLGRNTLIGPKLFNLNLSLVKTFRPREGQTVAFRSEFFNLFNHANFGVPNRFPLLTDGTPSGSAGVIQTLATSSRQIQFGLRYTF